MPSDPPIAAFVILFVFLVLTTAGLFVHVLRARARGRGTGSDFVRIVMSWMFVEVAGVALFVVYLITSG